MIEALHTGMMANVCVGEEVSDSFSITIGVEHGCVLVPTHFSIFLAAMLNEAFRDMGMASIYSQDRALTYSTSHTSERRPSLLGYWRESFYSQMTVHWLHTLLKRCRK